MPEDRKHKTVRKNHRSIKNIISIISVNILILLLFLAAVEFLSSLVIHSSAKNIVSSFRLNHTWKPNSLNEFHYVQSFFQNYNSQGWVENYDVAINKSPGTYRIFYMGDSFTQGTTPMHNSVPAIVEKRLNELAIDKNIKFEVINTGTSSYSPTIFYVLFRYVLLDYKPDLIVVNVDMTDDFDDWKYSQTLINDSEGNPSAVPPRNIYNSLYIDTRDRVVKATFISRLQLFLAHRSYAYQLIAKIKGRYINRDNDNDIVADNDSPNIYQRWAWCSHEWDQKTEDNVKNTLGLLRKLVNLALVNNVKIVLTSVPHYEQYSNTNNDTDQPDWSGRPHYEIAKVADEVGVPYLNSFELLMPVIKGTNQTTYYIENDMHFNDSGYRIWAETHVNFLTDKTNDLLPIEFY